MKTLENLAQDREDSVITETCSDLKVKHSDGISISISINPQSTQIHSLVVPYSLL